MRGKPECAVYICVYCVHTHRYTCDKHAYIQCSCILCVCCGGMWGVCMHMRFKAHPYTGLRYCLRKPEGARVKDRVAQSPLCFLDSFTIHVMSYTYMILCIYIKPMNHNSDKHSKRSLVVQSSGTTGDPHWSKCRGVAMRCPAPAGTQTIRPYT